MDFKLNVYPSLVADLQTQWSAVKVVKLMYEVDEEEKLRSLPQMSFQSNLI